MIISGQEVNWKEHQPSLSNAADNFIQYFSHMGNIEDYIRFVKMEVISGKNTLFSLKDEFFN